MRLKTLLCLMINLHWRTRDWITTNYRWVAKYLISMFRAVFCSIRFESIFNCIGKRVLPVNNYSHFHGVLWMIFENWRSVFTKSDEFLDIFSFFLYFYVREIKTTLFHTMIYVICYFFPKKFLSPKASGCNNSYHYNLFLEVLHFCYSLTRA